MPISFTVREPGGIRGVLLDDRGAPLEGELVHAIAAVNAGTSQHVPVERVRTGAGGRFEFTPLPRGQYVLVLNLDDRPESTEFDRRAYHPGTRVPGEAKIVTVDGPTIVDAGTFQLPTLSNEPLRASSSGAMGLRLPTPSWFCTARRREVPLDTAGRFRVTLPYGARFTLRAKGRREVSGRVRESSDVIHRNRSERSRSRRAARAAGAAVTRLACLVAVVGVLLAAQPAAQRGRSSVAAGSEPGGEADSILVHAGQLIVPLHNVGAWRSRDRGKSWRLVTEREESWGMTKAGPDLFVFKQRGLHRAADLGARWVTCGAVPRPRLCWCADRCRGNPLLLRHGMSACSDRATDVRPGRLLRCPGRERCQPSCRVLPSRDDRQHMARRVPHVGSRRNVGTRGKDAVAAIHIRCR